MLRHEGLHTTRAEALGEAPEEAGGGGAVAAHFVTRLFLKGVSDAACMTDIDREICGIYK